MLIWGNYMSESNDNSKIIELPFSEVKPEHLGQELAPIEDPDVVSTEIAAPKKKKKGDDAQFIRGIYKKRRGFRI